MSRVKAAIAAVRAVGGIMGKGATNVNPVYRNQFTSGAGLGALKKIADKAEAKAAAKAAKDAADSYGPPVPGMGRSLQQGFIPNPSGTVKIKNMYTRSK
jgi:hypothetical protein